MKTILKLLTPVWILAGAPLHAQPADLPSLPAYQTVGAPELGQYWQVQSGPVIVTPHVGRAGDRGGVRPALGNPIVVPPRIPDAANVLPSPQPPTLPPPLPPAYRPPANGAIVLIPGSPTPQAYGNRSLQDRPGITPPPPVRREVPPVTRPSALAPTPGKGDPRQSH